MGGCGSAINRLMVCQGNHAGLCEWTDRLANARYVGRISQHHSEACMLAAGELVGGGGNRLV